jgi:hypothetical protein
VYCEHIALVGIDQYDYYYHDVFVPLSLNTDLQWLSNHNHDGKPDYIGNFSSTYIFFIFYVYLHGRHFYFKIAVILFQLCYQNKPYLCSRSQYIVFLKLGSFPCDSMKSISLPLIQALPMKLYVKTPKTPI